MIRAIAIKEIRETIGFAALALVVLAYLVHMLEADYGTNQIPFIEDAFFPSLGVVQYLLAIALGLRQSAWERILGTYAFLLHRPASPKTIFAAKMATGLVLLQSTAVIPILWHWAWASTPGTHSSPFEASMSQTAWCVWLALPIAYFGAFLSGVRPARWWGTRLLPGVAGSILFLLFGALGQVLPPAWAVSVAFAASLLLSAVLISMIFHVARTSDFA